MLGLLNDFFSGCLDGFDALDVFGLLVWEKLLAEYEHLHEILAEVEGVVAARDQAVVIVKQILEVVDRDALARQVVSDEQVLQAVGNRLRILLYQQVLLTLLKFVGVVYDGNLLLVVCKEELKPFSEGFKIFVRAISLVFFINIIFFYFLTVFPGNFSFAFSNQIGGYSVVVLVSGLEFRQLIGEPDDRWQQGKLGFFGLFLNFLHGAVERPEPFSLLLAD